MQMETEDCWVGLGAVGQRLANIASDFDPRTYGYRKLSDLVRKTGAFDIDQPEGRALRIRAKPKPPSKTRVTPDSRPVTLPSLISPFEGNADLNNPICVLVVVQTGGDHVAYA